MVHVSVIDYEKRSLKKGKKEREDDILFLSSQTFSLKDTFSSAIML